MSTGLPELPQGRQRSRAPASRTPSSSNITVPGNSRLAVLITFVISVAVLYFAREVLIPLALAILLSFVLTPLANWLEKLGLGRMLSVLLTTTLSLLLIVAVGWVMVTQTIALAENLPRYRDNIRQKISSVQPQSAGAFGKTVNTLKQIGEEVMKVDTPPPIEPQPSSQPLSTSSPNPPSSQPVTKPVSVEVVRQPTSVLDSITRTLAPLTNPLVSAGIVFLFAVFILLHRDDLRERLIALIGPERLTATMQAMDEGASRVSRYLLMLLIVNGAYGLSVGIGLSIIGVPNAILFGVLAALLRFIPYAGPWLGAAFPILLSLAEFDSWTWPLITVGLFVFLELISNNVLEPWLYGSQTGVSSTAVVASAVFWGWLWGPVGLILATPLTVCLVVMGRHVPKLEYLSVLLGDKPSLPPEVRLYQRLLATDYDEAFQLTQEYLKNNPLIDLYENVLIPALAICEHDRHAGRLEQGQSQFIYQSLRDLIEELGDRQTPAVKAKTQTNAQTNNDENADAKAEVKSPTSTATSLAAAAGGPSPVTTINPPLVEPPPPHQPFRAGNVLCIPARDEADEISALMLEQLLAFHGISARALTVRSSASDILDEMDKHPPASVCVCAMPPTATNHARNACKRILARFSSMKLIVGVWNTPDLDRARERIRTCGTDQVAATFTNAIELLRS